MMDDWDRHYSKLPAGASKRDRISGMTELGNPVYMTGNGVQYALDGSLIGPPQEPPAPLRTTRNIIKMDAEGRQYHDYAPATNGNAKAAWSALSGIAGGLWDAVEAPGNALAGKPVTNGDALNILGMVQLGGFGVGHGIKRNVSGSPPQNALASRGANLYTRPTQSEVGDELGRQYTGGLDIEGRPLVARYVVGRAPERKGEQSLPSKALAEIIQGLTGQAPEGVAARGLRGGAVGQARFERGTGRPLGVEYDQRLAPDQIERVLSHETGHLLDEVAGQIDTKGLSRELDPLFHYGVEGRERARNFTLPKHQGYSATEAPREQMAEALRQYMGAPDTMKAMAPKTAARIRAAVNSHPELSKLIQFNALAGGAIGLNALVPREGDDIRAYLDGLPDQY